MTLHSHDLRRNSTVLIDYSRCRCVGRGAVSAGLPHRASDSSVHAGRRKFRDAENALDPVAADKLTTIRASRPHNARLQPGRWHTNTICWYTTVISGAVYLPRHLVRPWELLGHARRLARFSTYSVRTEQMVPQNALPVFFSSLRHYLLRVWAGGDYCYHSLQLLPAEVSSAYALQIGHGPRPPTGLASRGHRSVTSWSSVILMLPMGDGLV